VLQQASQVVGVVDIVSIASLGHSLYHLGQHGDGAGSFHDAAAFG
jgi:hypothetical protein